MSAEASRDQVERFFDTHAAASLRLPDGWFGRPYDNGHTLTSTQVDGDALVVVLDEVQVLTIVSPTVVASEQRLLGLSCGGGSWEWTGYGTADRHRRAFGAGMVELVA